MQTTVLLFAVDKTNKATSVPYDEKHHLDKARHFIIYALPDEASDQEKNVVVIGTKYLSMDHLHELAVASMSALNNNTRAVGTIMHQRPVYLHTVTDTIAEHFTVRNLLYSALKLPPPPI